MNLGRLCQIILKSDKEISGYGQLAQHVIFAYHKLHSLHFPRCASLGPGRPCVHMGPPGTGTMRVHLPGTMWVHLRKGPSTDLDRFRSRVNGQDRSHYGSVSLSMLSNQNVHAVAAFYSSLISA